MHVKSLSLELKVGQLIKIGKGNATAEITKIEYHPKSGDIEINTTRGPRKVLTFSLIDTPEEDFECVADKYR